ncbi:MAG: MFS transporter [Eubacteriales bacterium]
MSKFAAGNKKAERLSSDFFALFWMHSCFQLFFTLPYIFVNTFLISIASDIRIAYVFNIILFIGQGVGMIFSTGLVRKFSARTIARIGIALYALSYLLLLVFKENSVKWMPLIAIISGIAGGFYWLGYMLVTKHTTTDDNRDNALGLIGTSTAVVQMAAPFCSGLIIYIIKGTAGYLTVFFISFIFAVVTFFLAGKVSSYNYEACVSKPLRTAFALAMKSGSVKLGLASEFGRGLYDGAFYIILNLLIYQLVKDEFMVGLNSFIAGGAGILFNLLAARVLRPSNRAKSTAVSASFLAVSIIVLGLYNSTPMLIAVSIVNAAVLSFTSIPNNSMYVNVIERLKEGGEHSPELFAFREIWLNLGRIAGVCLLLFIPQNMGWCIVGLFLLSISQYFTAFTNKRASVAQKLSGGAI